MRPLYQELILPNLAYIGGGSEISYWMQLKSVFEEIKQLQGGKCFFCSCQFDTYAQEHFLPWNFIFRTENFNITAACKTCNGSKNDRLPETKYLEKIIQ